MELRAEPPAALVSGLPVGAELRRAGRTGTAVATIYLGYKGLSLLERGSLRGPVASARRRWHTASARTLNRAALDLGGVLLKAAQFVGARADALPAAYTEELALVHDRVPPHPFEVVRNVLREELDVPLDSVFSRIWRRPIASASLAQVHRAWLRDGREVAVKVQRPEVSRALGSDLRTLGVVVTALERIEGELGLRSLLDELRMALARELDFRSEARNAERMAANFARHPRVRIPRPVHEHTRARVLVTEYLPGLRVTDVEALREHGVAPAELAEVLLEAWTTQIFGHRLFHADPHPGNVLVLPEPPGFRIALVDFGLVEPVPAAFPRALAQLLGGVLTRDAEAIAASLGALGLETRDGGAQTLRRSAELLLELVRRRSEAGRTADLRDLGEALSALLRSDPLVHVPAHLSFAARTAGLLGGVLRRLGARPDLRAHLLPLLASASSS